MANYGNVIKQKLILNHSDGAFLLFFDENQKNHKYNFDEGAFIDLHYLVKSCFESIDDDNQSVLTCGCGIAGCAGFYHFHSEITDNEILWDINQGKDLFKFDKNQYIDEVKQKIRFLMDLCQQKKNLEYFFGETVDMEQLKEIYSPFID